MTENVTVKTDEARCGTRISTERVTLLVTSTEVSVQFCRPRRCVLCCVGVPLIAYKPAVRVEACSLLLAVQDGLTSDRSCWCSSRGSAAIECWHILKEYKWQRLIPTDEGG